MAKPETEREKLTRKVAAIIAKAQHGATEGEAASFMEKARAMMAEHGLSVEELEHAGDPIDLESDGRTMSSGWQLDLFVAAARYWGCEVVTTRRYGSRRVTTTIAGKRSSLAAFRAMWPYLLSSVGREASRARTRGDMRGTQEVCRREVGRVLAHRLWVLYRNRDTANRDAADKRLKEHFGELEEDTRRRKVKPLQRGALDAANRIGLDDQVTGAGDVKMIGR